MRKWFRVLSMKWYITSRETNISYYLFMKIPNTIVNNEFKLEGDYCVAKSPLNGREYRIEA